MECVFGADLGAILRGVFRESEPVEGQFKARVVVVGLARGPVFGEHTFVNYIDELS